MSLPYSDSDDISDVVRTAALTIQNGRTLRSALNHLRSEVDELDDEILLVEMESREGEDGVVGESIDVIACALDIIFQHRPDITNREIADIMRRKCNKWAVKYRSAPACM